MFEAWRIFNNHLEENHPDYKSWNSRLSFLFVIPFLLFLAPPIIVSVLEGNPIPPPGRSIIVSAWGLAVAAVAMIIIIKYRGTLRFREAWSQQHPLAN